ncbi:MAG: response regulator, partial [Thiovulaceae bacterium]|nr:response regulator [Sulfurimonadaceae bacterium]
MVVEINVMIVDDDPVNLLFQKKIIQKNFSTIELFCCHNSQEALDLVQKQNIDLMILDVELPDIDGFELYERIRSICNVEIPAIYLSVHHKNQYIKKSFELGAIDYLIKPIDPNLYINRIKLYLELLSKNLELSELHRVSSETLDLVNHYVIASKADSKGIITEVTDAFCKISGYARDEMIGQPHNMVRHPEMSPDVFKEVWDTIKNGETWSGEIKNLKKDGSFYWVYAVISPMFDQEGHVTGYYSTRQDITADKEKTLHLK